MPYDTLYSIASRFHVPLPLLEQINGIQDPAKLRAGQVLIIPDATPAVTARHPSAHPARHARHDAVVRTSAYVVRPGDTLYRLAASHGTSVQAIEAINGLSSPAIRAGQVIRLPQPEARHHAAPERAGRAAYDETARPVPPQVPASRPVPFSAVSASLAPSASAATDAVPLHEAAGVASPQMRAAPPTRTARTVLQLHVREAALDYVGVPYRWAGTTASGVDCSGLVYAVYSRYVANLPRTSYDQWTAGVPVERADVSVGDLVFFNMDGSGASHVGIYIGDGQFVHAASSAHRVVVDRLDAPYYLTHYLGARRVL
jgi:peptidoglycan endopeptidase LytE